MGKVGDFFNGLLDVTQVVLDVAGFVPGLGAIPDVINGGISLLRGNWGEAAASFIAAIPGVGDASAIGTKGGKFLNFFKKVFNNADFIKGSKHFLGEITGLFGKAVKGVFDSKGVQKGLDFIGSAFNKVKGKLGDTKKVVKEVGDKAVKNIKDGTKKGWDKTKEIAEKVKKKIFDPVNAIKGMFLVEQTDIFIDNVGIPLFIKREYQSKQTRQRTMGRGWIFNYETLKMMKHFYI